MKRRGDTRVPGLVRAAAGCGGLLFALFAVAPTWALLVRPATELGRALAWSAERCEVLYSGIERRGDKYRPLVAFAWQAGGRERISARFEVLPNEYKTEEQARAQSAPYVAGQAAECYLDPTRAQAVLKRRTNAQLFLGLVPLLFLLPAALFLWLATRPAGQLPGAAGGGSGWLPGRRRPADVRESGGPVTLVPASTPLGRFLLLTAVMLVWNGVTGAFIAAGWSEVSLAEIGPGLLCFAPFPLVGLALLGSTVHRFLALFGPRPFLTLSRPALRPGEAVTVGWELRRLGWRARSVEVTLLGRERAPTGSESTASHVFLERRLEPVPGATSTSGRAVIQLPAGLMHSFEAGSFKLEWLVRVRAEVLLAPDLDEEFPLTVLPERPRP